MLVCRLLLYCVAVCSSVLQCVALFREHMDDVSASVLGEVEYVGMLHCVAVCCSVLHYFGSICMMSVRRYWARSSMLVCCRVLQSVAVCCNMYSHG